MKKYFITFSIVTFFVLLLFFYSNFAKIFGLGIDPYLFINDSGEDVHLGVIIGNTSPSKNIEVAVDEAKWVNMNSFEPYILKTEMESWDIAPSSNFGLFKIIRMSELKSTALTATSSETERYRLFQYSYLKRIASSSNNPIEVRLNLVDSTSPKELTALLAKHSAPVRYVRLLYTSESGASTSSVMTGLSFETTPPEKLIDVIKFQLDQELASTLDTESVKLLLDGLDNQRTKIDVVNVFVEPDVVIKMWREEKFIRILQPMINEFDKAQFELGSSGTLD